MRLDDGRRVSQRSDGLDDGSVGVRAIGGSVVGSGIGGSVVGSGQRSSVMGSSVGRGVGRCVRSVGRGGKDSSRGNSGHRGQGNQLKEEEDRKTDSRIN